MQVPQCCRCSLLFDACNDESDLSFIHEYRQPEILGSWAHCFIVQAKEHGILDTLKAAMHGDGGPLAEETAEKPRIPLDVAVDMEVT